MVTINPYLNFQGNTEAAFNFYKSVFGGEFIGGIRRFKDNGGGSNLSASDGEKVMHVALAIGPGNMIMGTDALESMGQTVQMGNNFYLSLNTESKEEAQKIFNALAEGGKIEMPLDDTFWDAYFGMVADKFGIQWMVSFENPKQ